MDDIIKQDVKVTIRSDEPITLDNLDLFTDAIEYRIVAEVQFKGVYYTELLILVDADAAKEFVDEYNETEPEETKSEWTGNIWDFFEDGPTSRMSEDNVIPASVDWWDDVEFEYY
ncbi:hypothetical protein EOM86_11570 [Candidatus Nomurabacteria bacterium]|nr:hypothetical protein [Candidatus Nomurabacteria bacterium]